MKKLGYQWGRKSRNCAKDLFCLAMSPLTQNQSGYLHLNYEVWSRWLKTWDLTARPKKIICHPEFCTKFRVIVAYIRLTCGFWIISINWGLGWIRLLALGLHSKKRTTCSGLMKTALNNVVLPIEIINNTRGGIVIFFTDNKRERVYWGANSSPGCRARRLLAELMLP